MALQTAFVEWKQNWIAFMDNILQLQILNVNSRNLYVPTYIQRVTIDPQYHTLSCKEGENVPVYFCPRGGIAEVSGALSKLFVKCRLLVYLGPVV